MNLSSMEYFAVLARERSFTKAAEKLYITQQSLSSHIASLEKELGCQLLIRHIPLELTYAGEVFLRYAESICPSFAMRKAFVIHRRTCCGNSMTFLRTRKVFCGLARRHPADGRSFLPPFCVFNSSIRISASI